MAVGRGQAGPPIIPAVPLLAQTWSFIDLFDTHVGEEVRSLPRVPGFWTVFEATTMDQIMALATIGAAQQEETDHG